MVALNGYRHDCLDAMVYATRDEAKHGEIGDNTCRTNPSMPLLKVQTGGWWIVGTDGGAYDRDGGQSFSSLHRTFPGSPCTTSSFRNAKMNW